MLKKLHLKNFQKHEDLCIDLTDRNVIQGQSDRGKSSILRALHWVCFNRPSGTDFRRENTDTVEVTVYTDQGDVITRGRSKKESYYILNGDKYTGIGTDVPEPITKALPISSLNISRQHEGHFLLSGSKPDASRYIFSLIGLEEMDKSLSVAESKRRGLNSQHISMTEELETKKERFKKYKNVPEMVERLHILEKMNTRLQALQSQKSGLQSILSSIASIETHLIPIPEIDSILTLVLENRDLVKNSTNLANIIDTYNAIAVPCTLEQVKEAEDALLSLNSLQEGIYAIAKQSKQLRAELDVIQNNERSMLSLKKELYVMEDVWKKEMKDICPLCGGTI